MNTCQICRAAVGCSCNLRTTSDGKKVCSACLPKHEHSLLNPPTVANTQTGIQINSITHRVGK